METPSQKYIVSIRVTGSGDWSIIGKGETLQEALDLAFEMEKHVALWGVQSETRVFKETK